MKFQLITTQINVILSVLSCFTFYKGNEISANHNLRRTNSHRLMVVSPSTKVMKFQLITTESRISESFDCCFTFYKGNEISANHNVKSTGPNKVTVVSPSTKVMKFQLITTSAKARNERICCFTFYKGNEISANHNEDIT